MMDKAQKRNAERAGKDLKLTALAGPVQIIVTTLFVLTIYPIILDRSGLEVLGLWSLTATTAMYMNLTDIGFSTLLMRKVVRLTSLEDLGEIRKDLVASRRFYCFAVAGVMFLWIIYAFVMQNKLHEVYPRGYFVGAVSVLIVATYFQLQAQLYFSILSGIHETYITQIVNGVLPVVRFAPGIIGALMLHPIEGLAIGVLIHNYLKSYVGRYLLLKKLPTLLDASFPIKMAESWRRSMLLMKEGWHFYSISVGFILREPLFRLVITLTLGLATTGVYDMAMKIPFVLRSIITSGTKAFFPSFTSLYTELEKDHIKLILQKIVGILVVFGVVVFGCYFLLVDIILRIWLGEVPEGLIDATRMFTIWSSITLLNVPYWFLLQASGNERIAALSLWMHTFLILLLCPASFLYDFSLLDYIIYWTVASLITQMYIYFCVEKMLGLFLNTMVNAKQILFIISGIVLVVGSIVAREAIEQEFQGNLAMLFLYATVYGAACFILFGPFVWKVAHEGLLRYNSIE
jgi:O-antigen/teichoic acid export membrane protein